MINKDIKVGIYCGKGVSHSWLWFVDVLERFGLFDLYFFDENDVIQNGLDGLDIFIVSGGDTFALAKNLKPNGASKLRSFVEKGGLYIGSCAGAYLPMHSSKEFLRDFNFVKVKIANLTKTLPPAKRLIHKYYTCYGCRYVFHPIRGEVKIRLKNGNGFVAPIFGGPSMVAQEGSEALGWYSGFTPGTVFLTQEEIAQKVFIGKEAIVRCKLGKGKFYLFGPHLEHPKYKEANEYVINLIQREVKQKRESRLKEPLLEQNNSKQAIKAFKRELSNSRIVAYSMEHLPVLWKIEEKVYEPQKIIVFLESMWKRLKKLERTKELSLPIVLSDKLLCTLKELTFLIRELKREVNSGLDSTQTVQKVLLNLLFVSKLFFKVYFFVLKQKKEMVCTTQ